ncbi:MAG: TetR/AcrR family transcriptional regulator [Lachnospiraceae bacterium]|nr:TetR/AcrR family transcriptional regulator [Lachnospiraceae bacterium]
MDLQGLQTDWMEQRVPDPSGSEKNGRMAIQLEETTAKRTDLRVTRTERLIREAFLHLLTEQDFDDIRIKQIAERAGINRKTFYSHYEGKETLYEQMVRELLSELCGSLIYRKEEPGWELQRDLLPADAKKFLTFLEEYREEVMILINPRFNIRWYPILEEVIVDLREDLMLRSEEERAIGQIPLRLYLDMITSQLVIWIYWWMSQEEYEIDEGALILSRVMNRSMANVFRYVKPARVGGKA